MTMTKSLRRLAQSSDTEITGPFTSESILLHRLVFAENYRTEFDFVDERGSFAGAQDGCARRPAGADRVLADWYYVRVVQTNGSIAWSSPIWLVSTSASAKNM
jgi:hypothetical protein